MGGRGGRVGLNSFRDTTGVVHRLIVSTGGKGKAGTDATCSALSGLSTSKIRGRGLRFARLIPVRDVPCKKEGEEGPLIDPAPGPLSATFFLRIHKREKKTVARLLRAAAAEA